MKKAKKERLTPETFKRKFAAALAMLLISTILLVFTTYAWLVLSVAPEVSGITTNIGANGALEIALLTTETHDDMSKISGLGKSIVKVGALKANTSWGNLLELGDSAYGLSHIVLQPTRLNLSGDELKGYTVSSGILGIPTYGYDGRFIDVNKDSSSVTAIYSNSSFSYVAGQQDYGVRAIGTIDSVNAISAALDQARSNAESYINSANNYAAASMSSNGGDLFQIVLVHYTQADASFDDSHVKVIKSLVSGFKTSSENIEYAIKQAIIGYAASQITDIEQLDAVRTYVNANTPSAVKEQYPDYVPDILGTCIEMHSKLDNNIRAAENACNRLSGGSYTWEQIKGLVNYIMDDSKAYLNDKIIADYSASDAVSLMGKQSKLTLPSGSGIPADIADLVGDFGAAITGVDLNTLTNQNPPYMIAVTNEMRELTTVGGESLSGSYELSGISGYALDLAFRTNANNVDLLLQTDGVQRIYSDSTASGTQGGGSYMEFSANDPTFSADKMIKLMDAVRVGFIDGTKLLGVAKLNMSNKVVDNGTTKAPLYLYDFNVDEEGSMIMDERQKPSPVLTTLSPNVPKAVTVVVWLDGDTVDNSMVSATRDMSVVGNLNLQFSTNAPLVPAKYSTVYSISTNKDSLTSAIAAYQEKYAAGQGQYTSASWKPFTDAYEYAVAVKENENATQTQITNAVLQLDEANSCLSDVTHESLQEKISDARNIVGKTDEVGRLVTYDKQTKEVVTLDPENVTQKEFDNAVKIYTVNYDLNTLDNGNDVISLIYSESSWRALAAALYDAEAFDLNIDATEAELDEKIQALDVAITGLERKVYFRAYNLDGQLYYFALSDDPDTYGKWYDNTFKLVVSDLKILELDAKAVPAEIATVDQNEYVKNDPAFITPTIKINTSVYPELENENIVGVQWMIPEPYLSEPITDAQRNTIDGLILEATSLGLAEKTEALIVAKNISDSGICSSEKAKNVITDLNSALSPLRTAANEKNSALILLNKVILAAKEVDGYSSESENEAIRNLVEAVNSAEDLLSDENCELADIRNAIDSVNEALKAAGQPEVTNDPDPEPVDEVSDDQKTLLYTAINTAKGIEGYYEAEAYYNKVNAPADPEPDGDGGTDTGDETNDPESGVAAASEIDGDEEVPSEKLLALVIAVKDAVELLENEDATGTAADEKLNSINAALVALDTEEVTAYNTLKIKVPIGNDSYEIVNRVDIPGAVMYINEKVGTASVYAVVITESGIVYTTQKIDYTLYTKAAGAELILPDTAPVGGEMIDLNAPDTDETDSETPVTPEEPDASETPEDPVTPEEPAEPVTPELVWNRVMLSTASVDIKLKLANQQKPDYSKPILDENGQPIKDENGVMLFEYVSVQTSEHIKSYSWASSNVNVAIIEDPESAVCTVKGVAHGTTSISVTIETVEGNEYTAEFELEVTYVKAEGIVAVPESITDMEISETETETVTYMFVNHKEVIGSDEETEDPEEGEDATEPGTTVIEIPTTEKAASVKFISNNTNVVTVDDNGIVTAVGGGDTTVTVKVITYDSNEYLATVSVSVKYPELEAETDAETVTETEAETETGESSDSE